MESAGARSTSHNRKRPKKEQSPPGEELPWPTYVGPLTTTTQPPTSRSALDLLHVLDNFENRPDEEKHLARSLRRLLVDEKRRLSEQNEALQAEINGLAASQQRPPAPTDTALVRTTRQQKPSSIHHISRSMMYPPNRPEGDLVVGGDPRRNQLQPSPRPLSLQEALPFLRAYDFSQTPCIVDSLAFKELIIPVMNFISPSMAALMGCSQEALVGKAVTTLRPGLDSLAILAAHRLLRSESAVGVTFSVSMVICRRRAAPVLAMCRCQTLYGPAKTGQWHIVVVDSIVGETETVPPPMEEVLHDPRSRALLQRKVHQYQQVYAATEAFSSPAPFSHSAHVAAASAISTPSPDLKGREGMVAAAALELFSAHPFIFGPLVLVALLALIVKVREWRKYGGYNLPPVVSSLIPFVGSGLSFAGGPLQYTTEAYKKYGDIFTMKVFGQRLTFLVGPDAHVPFFSQGDAELSQDEPYQFSVPIFGPNVVYGADLAHRNQQLKFIAASLSTKALQSYVPLIVKEAEDFFAKWDKSGTVDIRDALAELIILTASRCLMGKEIRENLFTEVAKLYQTLDEGLLPISVFFPYLPIPAHKRRDEARLAMVRMFKKIIDERRANPEVKHNDCLQVFMDARYRGEEQALNDEEITGLMIALLFAGQHTSSVTGSWTGLLLFEANNKKKFLPGVLEEQEEIRKEFGDELTMEALNKMDKLHRCVKEALRMYPPLLFVMRKVIKPFSYKDYYVPEGDIAFVSPALSMRVEEVFPNADQYNPERFVEEDKQTQKYRFVGFGAGRHGCMGENFAYLQIKTIWSVLLRNFDIELVGELPKPDYTAMVVGPAHPCLLRYTRK